MKLTKKKRRLIYIKAAHAEFTRINDGCRLLCETTGMTPGLVLTADLARKLPELKYYTLQDIEGFTPLKIQQIRVIVLCLSAAMCN